MNVDENKKRKKVAYNKEAVNWPNSNQFVFFSVEELLVMELFGEVLLFLVHNKICTINAVTSLVRKTIFKNIQRVAHLIYPPELQTHKSLGTYFPDGFLIEVVT